LDVGFGLEKATTMEKPTKTYKNCGKTKKNPAKTMEIQECSTKNWDLMRFTADLCQLSCFLTTNRDNWGIYKSIYKARLLINIELTYNWRWPTL